MNWQFKDLRKAAFAVGFGFTMGKVVDKMVEAALGGVVLGTVKFAAKEGNGIAQEVCEKADIKFEPKENEGNETNKVIGFHCE